MRYSILSLFLGLAVVPMSPCGQPVLDRDTLLLLQLDGSVDTDFSRGTSTASRESKLGWVNGRFGGGANMRGTAEIGFVGNDGNFHAPSGTIEFWVKPHWPGNDGNSHNFLSLQMGERKYIHINTRGTGQLGMAIAAGDGESWRWSRADADISDWQANSWHHVVFVWGDGRIRVYADGTEGTSRADGAPMPDALPKEIRLGPSDAVIDALRISKRAYTAEDVRRAIAEADYPPYHYLSDLNWVADDKVIVGNRRLLGGIQIPLILGNIHSPNAIALPLPARVSAEVPHFSSMLVGRIGVSPFSKARLPVRFEAWGDGKRLFQSPPQMAGAPPVEMRVPLSGVKVLTLKLSGKSNGSLAEPVFGIWHGAVVQAETEAKPYLGGRKLSPAEIDMYARQLMADAFTFKPSQEIQRPFFITPKYWEDEIDPSRPPLTEDIGRPVKSFATPGEFEPLNFVLYATEDLKDVGILIEELHAGNAVIPKDAFDVRIVLRGLMRELYTLPPERSTVVSRFLLPNQLLNIPSETFREYHIIAQVPEDTPPGAYSGRIRVTASHQPAQEVEVNLEVLPFRLDKPRDKAYGVYYWFPRSNAQRSIAHKELADIRDHGCTRLVTNLGIRYALIDDKVIPQFADLKRGLELLKEHRFHGPLVVETRADQAARLLEYDPVADYHDENARARFFSVIKGAMKNLLNLNNAYPQFEFLVTHMDEVFGKKRLDRFLRLTEAVRQVPSLPLYMTIHNDPDRDPREKMRQSDPFIDVRSYNGHSMDSWIRAGHSFEDLRRDLQKSGDEGWIYHNIRGAFFLPEWMRIVNGYYLWMSPLKTHAPWIYHFSKSNPIDDTDGPRRKGGDFAFAVPDPQDATKLIPTRHWEAFREGIDDIRYLGTLERLIARGSASQESDAAAKAAHAWLRQLREEMIPTAVQLASIEAESPILVYLSAKLDGARYRQIRSQAAHHIQKLLAVH